MLSVHVDAADRGRDGPDQVLSTVLELRARGHRTVLVARPDTNLERRASEGLEFVALSPHADRDYAAGWRLSRVLKTLRPRIVHAHDPHATATAALALSLGAPTPPPTPRRLAPRERPHPQGRLFAMDRRTGDDGDLRVGGNSSSPDSGWPPTREGGHDLRRDRRRSGRRRPGAEPPRRVLAAHPRTDHRQRRTAGPARRPSVSAGRCAGGTSGSARRQAGHRRSGRTRRRAAAPDQGPPPRQACRRDRQIHRGDGARRALQRIYPLRAERPDRGRGFDAAARYGGGAGCRCDDGWCGWRDRRARRNRAARAAAGRARARARAYRDCSSTSRSGRASA